MSGPGELPGRRRPKRRSPAGRPTARVGGGCLCRAHLRRTCCRSSKSGRPSAEAFRRAVASSSGRVPRPLPNRRKDRDRARARCRSSPGRVPQLRVSQYQEVGDRTPAALRIVVRLLLEARRDIAGCGYRVPVVEGRRDKTPWNATRGLRHGGMADRPHRCCGGAVYGLRCGLCGSCPSYTPKVEGAGRLSRLTATPGRRAHPPVRAQLGASVRAYSEPTASARARSG